MNGNKLTTRVLCLMAAISMMLSSCTQTNGFKIKRGTNLSHWLSQSWERGEARAKHIQEDDFARLHELGFDHVRIPIDEVQFWDEDGNKLPEAWDLLTNALDLARKYDIRAIVDLHVIRSHNFNAVNMGMKNALFTDEAAQQQLIDMWYQLSDVLKDYSTDWVAYEFMNEPVDRDLAYAWTRDMISVFDEFDIAWTSWCYDADFGFWDQNKEDYKDKELVEILLSGKGL